LDAGDLTRVMNIPNILTLARLCAVPLVIVAIVQGQFLTAFLLFAAAGVTDGVDGYIAKRFEMRTELGAYLDPLADKALLVSIFIALAIERSIPIWLTVLVVSRDIMIIGAVIVAWIIDKPLKIAPSMISKANTAAQIVFAAFILAGLAFGFATPELTQILAYGVAALTVASIAAYLGFWLRHMTA
jgi:cardiolipin synthase (CMP-forming)